MSSPPKVDPAAQGNSLPPIEIDEVSFLVRAQKFRISATAMRRSPISLATEYAIRLIHLVPEIGPDAIGEYFGFEEVETRVLLQDILETGLVLENSGRLTLSARGYEAISPVSEELEIFAREEIRTSQSFDLIALAPVDEVSIAPSIARRIPEISIPDREKAANAGSQVGRAFEDHFLEWRQRNGTRNRTDDLKFEAAADVQQIKTFAAPFHISIQYHQEDPVGLEPDFRPLQTKGRPGSRKPLIEALSARLSSMRAPPDADLGFRWLRDIDGDLLSLAGFNGMSDVRSWMAKCQDETGKLLTHPYDPGLRLAGSISGRFVRNALIDWTRLQAPSDPTPLFWIPPHADYWGKSLAFAAVVRELNAQEAEGIVLMARNGLVARDANWWRRTFGRSEKHDSLFDRCIGVSSDLPKSLEVIVKPNSWALALVHTIETRSGLPLPIGYITADNVVVQAITRAVADVASTAPSANAMLWIRQDETPDAALNAIDTALGIETV
ncbi:hypothetical protein [Pseudorhizobium flavum]|uniref:Uncharacterized protein n=1 Tax=Pseudorhizobium flavum TaxID=1335061 RepID=A0A7X0DEE2_9HYPH|nr:hypothetical protein [Pseudorhizobium flavum]MBB6181832.1 hypothetical protein [Pseudorhizobium flavum]